MDHLDSPYGSVNDLSEDANIMSSLLPDQGILQGSKHLPLLSELSELSSGDVSASLLEEWSRSPARLTSAL